MLYVGPGRDTLLTCFELPIWCHVIKWYRQIWVGKYFLLCENAVLLHLDKTLQSIVTSLAARGRGKSATLGFAIAGAIAAG